MSLQSQVTKIYKELNNPTLKEVVASFPDVSRNTIKSCYYRSKKVATADASVAYSDSITMEKMEKLLVKQLKKKPDVATLRLMVDFLKLKSQDHSELQEIDLDIFYKKAMEE